MDSLRDRLTAYIKNLEEVRLPEAREELAFWRNQSGLHKTRVGDADWADITGEMEAACSRIVTVYEEILASNKAHLRELD